MEEKNQHIRIDHWIVAVLLFAMASIAFINVLSRYLFHFSFAATEEITINLFVWMTVIGSGIAFERGGQLGMVTLYNIFPKKFKKIIILFSSGLSAAIYFELTIFNATSAGLGIPVWIYYIGVPILSIFVFQGIYRDASSKLDGLERKGKR
ncbi:MAG: TRAP transporter small permease subunit [Deltaproteobacteria bacterium]|nr:TRAP transporter small permease subunit [Deltaproteobacteria bacterium]